MVAALRSAARRGAPFAGAAFALGAGLVLLGRKSLWTDEAVAVQTAHRPFSNLVDFVVEHDPAGAGYVLLLHPIVHLDDAEWAVRLPSVIAASLAALAMYALGTDLFGRRGGMMASLSLATSAGVFAASQQARPMPLALLAIVLTTLCFVRAIEHSGRWWLFYVLSTILLPLTHPVAASVLVAQLAALSLHPSRRKLALPGCSALACALAISAVPLVASAADRLRAPHEGDRLTLRDAGEGIGWATGWSPLLLALGVGGVVAVAIGRTPDAAPWKAGLVGGMILAPFLMVLAGGIAMPVFAVRALLASTPGLSLGVAAAIIAIADRRIRLASVVGLFAIAGAGVVVWLASPAIEDWRAATKAVVTGRTADETVLALPTRATAAVGYYAPELRLSGQARGAGAWVFVTEMAGPNPITAGRRVVRTPRYALLSQDRYGGDLVLQRWVRP